MVEDIKSKVKGIGSVVEYWKIGSTNNYNFIVKLNENPYRLEWAKSIISKQINSKNYRIHTHCLEGDNRVWFQVIPNH